MNYFWAFLVGAFVGAAALAVWQAPTTVVEAPAAAARQSDGSLALERTGTNPKAKSAAVVPKGGQAERSIRVDVQPARADCPVCTVELTLVRMPDDTRRVVAASPTGIVLSGLDVPLVPLEVARDRPWAAGASYGVGGGSWGGWLDRDLGPLRLGAEINQTGDARTEARVRLGWRF
jgi:hypothetical protein